MARLYSNKNPQEIRAERECGLFEAVKLAKISTLLDRVEAAETTEQLRELVAEFITQQTGIK